MLIEPEQLPDGWEVIELQKTFAFDTTGFWGNECSNNQGIKVLRATNFCKDGTLDYSKISIRTFPEKYKPIKLLHNYDIILERSGGSELQPVGRVALFNAGTGYSVSNFMHIIRINSKIALPIYIFYFLDFIYKFGYTKILQTATTGIRNLNYNEYKQTTVLLPPLSEQKQIATVLSSVDKVIEKTNELIEQTKKVKQSLLQSLLTKGIGHTKFKPSPLGEIPESWRYGNFSNIAYINPKNKLNISNEAEVSFIGMADVSENGKIANRVSKPLKEVIKGYTAFIEKDVLLAKITPCFENRKGTIAENLTNQIGFGSTEFHVLRAQKDNDYRFIYYHTITNKFRKMGAYSMTGTAGHKRVPAEFISSYNLAIPPLHEQQQIVDILISVDNTIQKHQEKLSSLQTLKKGLMQDLLTGKVRATNIKLKEDNE
ncbi:MAG: restriction endonuclease subunit S [Alphaproteobacteria bacterium]|nr:restriction endonuclease subunit S [Alphaproteobacteria bacterium]OJV11986.1 MAG: hypothetical protein BGO27_06440 [Alphaproteobacteria bacterium 33-17]